MALVFFSSQVGIVGHRRATAYAASKARVKGLTGTLPVEFAAFGANAVARSDPERRAVLVAAVPMGRFGQPAEPARAALFFASAASYSSSHVLIVEGGVTTN